MSKFEHSTFYGGYDTFAVSKEKYTKEQAVDLAKDELRPCSNTEWDLAVGDGFVRHRAGINEDGEPCVGWWLEYSRRERSCPVWAFHCERKRLDSGYEYVHFGALKEDKHEQD